VKLQETIYDASFMIEYLKDHNIRNYHYNKNNKYIVKLHSDYHEKIHDPNSGPITLLYQKKKLEDIIIEVKINIEKLGICK